MDLLIVDTTVDFIAVKSGACLNCSEAKLGVKIMRVMKLSDKDCNYMRQQYGLRAVAVKCECGNFKAMY